MRTKKLFAMLLAAVMLLSVVPITAGAETYEDFEYKIHFFNPHDYIEITGYIGEGGDVVIPDYIDGNPVREIGRDAFAGHHTITSVTIPETVDTIHDRAFYNCDGLTEVVLPTSVLVIGEEAFAACSFLKTVVSEGGLEIVRNLAFANCISLETVTFPDSVKELGDEIFGGCLVLERFRIPKNVTSLGYVFYNCKGLSEIFIPDNVENLERYAFYNCINLEKVTFDSDCLIETIGTSTFENCKSLKTIEILAYTTMIEQNAFAGCENLESVTYAKNSSLTKIGWAAFDRCSSLEHITFPESVKELPSYGFADCTSLKTAVIPDSVTGIDENLFKGCVNLTDIYCQAASQPAGWHAGWANNCAALVHWGYDIPCEHNFTKNVTVFATCEEDGYKVTVCKNCAAELFREEYKALGHDIEHRDGKAPTCTENGWNAYEACTRCAYSTYEEIPATGHEYAETITEPLCTVPGKIHHACIYCDRAYAEYIPAKGHDYVGGVCTACGKSLIAEYGIDLSVSDATAFAGETVTVEVTLDKNVGFTYLNLLFDYDADALELVSVTNGTIVEELTQGRSYIWACADNATATGVLLTLTFVIKEDAPTGDYGIAVEVIECCNQDELDVGVTVRNGNVKVVDFVYGDCTGDGKINGQDVTRLLRYLASYDPMTGGSSVEISLGADCTGDGKINGKDVTRLLRYLASFDPMTGESSVTLGK